MALKKTLTTKKDTFKKAIVQKTKPKTKHKTKPAAKPKTKTSPKKKTLTKKPVKKTVTIKKPPKSPKKAVKPAKSKTTTKPSSGKAKNKKKLTLREKMIQDIKRKLQAQRSTLLAEAESALNTLPDQTIFPDLGDQASAEIDRNFMLRLRGREQMLLKKIDQAIEKIDSGTFGICDTCGQEIEIKRLEARPVTTMCITCKTEQEEEEKLRGL
jgi:DnaK suppressor protein